MSSKCRQKYRNPWEAYLGGIIRQFSWPYPISFDEMDENERQREVEWLDYMEKDGPGWDKYMRGMGEKCAWEIPLTPEQKAARLKRRPLLARAIAFAGNKHAEQTRKDKKETPYIEHLFAVCTALMLTGEVTDQEILAAAMLHDTLEDTETTPEELENIFSARVRALVEEVTDDKSLRKEERKYFQIEHASRLSKDAALIKLADKISNVSDIIFNPPRDWTVQRREDYLTWAEAVVAECPHANPALKERFGKLVAEGRALLGNPKLLRDTARIRRKEAEQACLEMVTRIPLS